MEIILFQPDIPQNTGNIARTCALTGTCLTLVRPLGFSLSTRHMKRSGLDYWKDVTLSTVDSIEERLTSGKPFYFFSSKGTRPYTEIPFERDAILIFGSETKGLPETAWKQWPQQFYTIPMKPGGGRCLNLSNSVSIVLFEAWRQLDFKF